MAERTCIATGQNLPAYKLIRFVVAPDGFAVADLMGRMQARCMGSGKSFRYSHC